MPENLENALTEIKFVAGKDGEFEGYASVFGVVDNVRDVVERGAFKKSIDAQVRAGRMPALLWQHDAAQPIGKWLEMREDSKGLFVRGQLLMDVQKGREAYALMKENVVTGLSIGYRTIDSERDSKGIRHLKEVELLEVSIVTFPALTVARTTAVKNDRPKTEREFEELLRDAGFSRTEAKTIVSHGFKALQRDADDTLQAIEALTLSINQATQA